MDFLARCAKARLRDPPTHAGCGIPYYLVGAIPRSRQEMQIDLRPAEGFVRLGERSDLQGISLNGSGAGHAHVFQRLLVLFGLGGAG